jgi:environmental stress-induced protein Ves
MPWRNGGGTTYEIARDPPEGAEFRWRLSLARIDRPGPFSEFSGYQRAIALVSGDGCVLHGAAEQPIVLAAPGAIAAFPGEAAVNCQLRGGPCFDLNLMVRRPIAITSARYLASEDEVRDFAPDPAHLAVFCLSGALQCVSDGAPAVDLDAHDTLLVAAAEEAVRWRLRSLPSSAATAIVFQWRPPAEREEKSQSSARS